MTDRASDEMESDLHAASVPVTTCRRLLGAVLTGAVPLAAGSTLAAAARHDDHDEDDNDDDDRRHDHDDRGHNDDRGNEDAPRPATQLADGLWDVRITDDDAEAFIPGTIAIQPSESVTWTNNDDKPHTATGADWDTGTIEPGASATVVFDTGGSCAYACQFHPVMTGSVAVQGEEGTPGATPAASPATDGDSVRIFNLAYEPTTLTVAAGSTVTWANDDSLPHTATGENGDFDTSSIAAGATAEETFDTPGTFAYVCAFHPGMSGTIVVT